MMDLAVCTLPSQSKSQKPNAKADGSRTDGPVVVIGSRSCAKSCSFWVSRSDWVSGLQSRVDALGSTRRTSPNDGRCRWAMPDSRSGSLSVRLDAERRPKSAALLLQDHDSPEAARFPFASQVHRAFLFAG